MSGDFEAARRNFIEGVSAFEADRLPEAETLFMASLQHWPGRPSTLINLAAVRHRLGRPAEALVTLDEALGQTPDDAQAWYQHGQLLQALQRPLDALRSYERMLALKPDAGAGWSQRGGILKDLGRLAEAAQSFERALEHGADAELNRFLLASVQAAAGAAAAAPAQAPRAYVEGLFDSYAEDFDAHLVQGLGYRTPWLLAEQLPPGRRFGAALDLGCGTGLMGPLLAPRCEAIDGVDLSLQMLRKAGALACYRDLEHAEVVEHLQRTARRYELVVAADVFVYFGDLGTVFAGVMRVLAPGALFAFSVEEAQTLTTGPGYELRASSRYAHVESYLREQAADAGFSLRSLVRCVLRHEQQRPIGGLMAVLAHA